MNHKNKVKEHLLNELTEMCRRISELERSETELKLVEETLRREKETFFFILENAPYGVVLMDKERILYLNHECTNILGYTLKDIPTATDSYHKFYPDPKYRQMVYETWAGDISQDGIDNRVFSVVCKDGKVKEIEFKTTFLENGRVMLMLSDITERKRQEKQLAYIATHDTLTSLPNRVLLNDRLTLAIAHAHRNRQILAVVLLDLNNFKDVNDTLGHAMGDKLLQTVGDKLKNSLRRTDTVARIGGDEFVLLLPEITKMEHTAKIAQKILGVFREPFVIDDRELSLTASVGVAIYPTDGEDVDTLINHADIAMYHVKREDRNSYQYYKSEYEPRCF